MSYLAPAFRYAPTYDVGLNTGTPEVGGTIRRPKNKKTPEEEKVPSEVPRNGNGSGGSEASANNGETAGLSRGTGIANARGVGYSAAVAGAGVGASNNGDLNQSQFNTLIHPNPISAPASPTKTTVAPAASSPGFWSQVGHDISSIGHNSVVRDVMSFGDPFKSSDTGLAGAINPSYNSGVIEPSNVYSPSRNFPEVSSGSPNVVQGSVVGSGSNAVGSAGQKALPSSIYESPYRASLGKQFMSTNGSAAESTPWYDSIPNDISSIGEDVLSAL